MKTLAGLVLMPLAVLLTGAGLWLHQPDKPRAFLEARYAAPPSEFKAIAGLRIHLRDTGPREAPAILLLHGFAASLHTWEDWAGPLSATRRVVRFDLPGFGLTGPDPRHDYSDERAMQVIAAVMDRLGIARATLVGHSLGGRLAWRFAAEFPQRVERLVLVAPAGFETAAPQPELTPVAQMLPFALPTPLLRATLAYAYADPAVLTETRLARYRDMLLAPGVREAIVARFEQLAPIDPRPYLRRIKVPTLLLWGTRDGLVPFAQAGEFLAGLRDVRLVPFPGIGHLPQEEVPQDLLAALREFLGG